MKTLKIRVNGKTGDLTGLAFSGDFGTSDVHDVLRILTANVAPSDALGKLLNRLELLKIALAPYNVILEAIIEG